MCGRFVISSNNPYGLQYKSSYNVAPSQFIPVKTKDTAKLMNSLRQKISIADNACKLLEVFPFF